MSQLIPGIDDLAGLLEMLKDNKQAAKQIARLQELSDEIALQLEIQGTIEEIKVLRGQADRDRDQAHRELVEAHLEADVLRTQLAKERKEMDEHCRKSLSNVTDEHNKLKNERRLADDALRTREGELQRATTKLAEREVNARAKEQWADGVIKEYGERTNRLKEFASKV